MRISDLVSMGREYLTLGLAVVFCLGIVFAAGYCLVYKKLLHGTRRVSGKRLLCAAALLTYAVVVCGATLLGRGPYYEGRAVWQPFYSYREAWNSFSAQAWRNLLLNICMFVPFGFLLPLMGGWWRRFYRTYAAGLLFSLLIENVQLVFQRGIFEFDDIFNNVLGTMVGYGCFRLAYWSYLKRARGDAPVRPVLLAQLPLALVVGMSGVIFGAYQAKEFGNLSVQYIRKLDLSRTEIRLQTELSQDAPELAVYKGPVVDAAEAERLAQEFFGRIGAQVDKSRTDIYDELAVFFDDGGNYCVWVGLCPAGGTLSFTDFSQSFSEYEGLADASEADLRAALAEFGVQVPETAAFSGQENGNYVFAMGDPDAYGQEKTVYLGSLSCTWKENRKISSFYNAIIACEKYRGCKALSEQEAYGRLCDGKFQYYGDAPDVLEISGVSITYRPDSKGFYQPVYVFEGMADGEKTEICIPAI